MYCSVPNVGGATNFRNSGVHIKPTKYAATFFSNVDPVTMKMDDSLTEHSGCPVVEGETKIVKQWVRLGVDDENPWSASNTREFFVGVLLCAVESSHQEELMISLLVSFSWSETFRCIQSVRSSFNATRNRSTKTSG